MKTILNDVNRILVDIGRYHSKDELAMDALRTLIRTKPELRRDVAVELYKKKQISLSRGAEICGFTMEDFKELLKENGIKIFVPEIPAEEVDREVNVILGLI